MSENHRTINDLTPSGIARRIRERDAEINARGAKLQRLFRNEVPVVIDALLRMDKLLPPCNTTEDG